jgi:voltage-gated potassium channel
MLLIVASIAVVMLESVVGYQQRHAQLLYLLEWIFTAIFTVEYALRIYCVRRRLGYVLSFYGIVDLLSILPTWLSLFWLGAQSMVVIRGLRLLRVFRVFKLVRCVHQARELRAALSKSLPKLFVFLTALLVTVIIIGTAMYLVEGRSNAGFANIPQSVYWAIVTVTTVGYGDTVPITVLGKVLAAVLMVLGFAFVVVSAGVVFAELVNVAKPEITTQACPECMREGHDADAKFCKHCGARL